MSRPCVAVVGGGLAGMAAALSLCEAACDVTLFEARRQLGGRATSFRDPATGERVDFCQHVSMGCCTQLADFCQRTGIANQFSREPTLTFIAPNGRATEFSATRWLPAPLHLAAALMRMSFLSWPDRLRIVKGLLDLKKAEGWAISQRSMLDWLQAHGQSSQAIELFWGTVLVSALGDTLDRVSVSASRKVFVDGFMTTRDGYEVLIPSAPLSKLFGEDAGRHLAERGVKICLSTPVKNIRKEGPSFLLDAQEQTRAFDAVVIAVTWRQIADLIAPTLRPALPSIPVAETIESSPITGIHLWYDRPITARRHAVILGRLSQWLFSRGKMPLEDGRTAFYYQIVVSGSRMLSGLDRQEVVRRIHGDLSEIFPDAKDAQILQSKVVTEPHAVFTVRPGLDSVRPSQKTEVPGLFLAGDWTATDWPATMEGAVRSGNLAAKACLGYLDSVVIPAR